MSTTTNRRGPPVGLHRLVGSDLLCTHTVSFEEVDNVGTGTRARRLRTDRRLSLREVARRLGWSAAYVSDLERGRRGWKPETADKYATAIGANAKISGCGAIRCSVLLALFYKFLKED